MLNRLGQLPHCGSKVRLGRGSGEAWASDPGCSCLTVPLMPQFSRMFYVDPSYEVSHGVDLLSFLPCPRLLCFSPSCLLSVAASSTLYILRETHRITKAQSLGF